MNKFFLFSAVLLWFTYVWSVEAQTDNCSKFTTNSTCLMNGNCGCVYLSCDATKSCVAANETTGRPLKMPNCNNFSLWYNCTKTSEDHNEGSAVKVVLIILACVLILGAAVGVFIWYRARRRRYSTVK